MEHPLIGDLSDLSMNDLSDKIADLNKKLAFATRMGNYTMANQVQMVLESYRKELSKKQAELFKESSGTIKGKIDISWSKNTWLCHLECDKLIAMRIDQYGQHIFTEDDLCELVMSDHNVRLKQVLTETPITYSYDLDLVEPPTLIPYVDPGVSVEEFDKANQSNLLMPQEYRDFDIVAWLLEQCGDDEAKLQRVGHELLLYVERDLIPLLQYLKYLVDTMRVNKIVWGVGRGSSVSSYVLFLIGVHKIDSMYYDLQIEDFLK